MMEPAKKAARKGGRPALGHTEQMIVRVSPELHGRIAAAALARDVTIAEYVRSVMERSLRSSGL
jgi:predicted HicB family RNase H-like nuclease